MFKYIVKRLLQTVIVLIGVTLVTFTLLHVVPGDPVNIMLEKRADAETIARVRHQMGLDRPYTEQYLSFLSGLAKGDLGDSYFQKKPVTDLVAESFSVTLKLGSSALLLAVILGLTVGIIAAANRGKFLDRTLMTVSILGISAPSFWIAIILQIVFGLRLKWLPISGLEADYALVLPTFALGTRFAAEISRITRTSMLDAMGHDYIQTARAKGVREFFVISKHALKNAIIPIVTYLGLSVGYILGGSVLVETVFSIQGMGKLMISAIQSRDIPVVQGVTVYIASIFVFINLVIDLLYGFLDPRVRTAEV